MQTMAESWSNNFSHSHNICKELEHSLRARFANAIVLAIVIRLGSGAKVTALYLESQLIPLPLSQDHPLIIDDREACLTKSGGIFYTKFIADRCIGRNSTFALHHCKLSSRLHMLQRLNKKIRWHIKTRWILPSYHHCLISVSLTRIQFDLDDTYNTPLTHFSYFNLPQP